MVTQAHTPSFTVEADLAGPVTRVVLRGELDLTAASALGELLALVLGKPPRDIVLETSGVTFIDCACARVIAQAAQALLGPGRLVIQSPSPVVRRMFHLTGLDAAIPMNELACPAACPGPASRPAISPREERTHAAST